MTNNRYQWIFARKFVGAKAANAKIGGTVAQIKQKSDGRPYTCLPEAIIDINYYCHS
jgi:hypothetical protein